MLSYEDDISTFLPDVIIALLLHLRIDTKIPFDIFAKSEIRFQNRNFREMCVRLMRKVSSLMNRNIAAIQASSGGLLEKDKHDSSGRTARRGQQERDKQSRTARTGHLKQNRQYRTSKAGQATSVQA